MTEPAPLKYRGDFNHYLKRFNQVEQVAVENLFESCEKHKADAVQILTSFAGIPLETMEDLSKEFEKQPRRSANLELMLFRDPGVVYPVYHAFAKHKLMIERELEADEAKKMADGYVRDARAESAKYYQKYGQPVLAKTKGEVQKVPWWAQIRLWKNGLSSDLPNNAFVDEFLRTLKEDRHQYALNDRLAVLLSFKPKGWSGARTFKDRLEHASHTPSNDNIPGHDVHDSLIIHEGTMESQMMHHMLMESPEKVKFTYGRLYENYARRRLNYRLAEWAEQFGQKNWKKELDQKIHEHILQTDRAIDEYHETFRHDYRIRVDHSLGTFIRKPIRHL